MKIPDTFREDVKKINHLEEYRVAGMEESGCSIIKVYNSYILSEIPRFGGEPILYKSYACTETGIIYMQNDIEIKLI